MQTFIALLRGINVSGQKKILMADLKKHFEELGFTNVQTYIQSRNVLFQSEEKNAAILQAEIEKMILATYNFEVVTLLRTPHELKEAINANPFLHEPEKELSRQYVTFLSEVPAPENLVKINASAYDPEEYRLVGTTLYFYSPANYGKAKMSNNFFENKLKLKATTRNWATVNKLMELAGKL